MSKTPENRLVVVNMAKSLEDIRERIYICPSKQDDFEVGYIHHPSKYLACYTNNDAILYVAVVAACVRVTKHAEDSVLLWKYSDAEDEELITKARSFIGKTKSPSTVPPRLVFLLEDLSSTSFSYDVGGGLQSGRIYFDLTQLEPTDVKDLAVKLRTVSWSTLPKWKPA